ncbi:MAG: type II toxin-antitoxin system RelE/ParE family toxin [bacterium]
MKNSIVILKPAREDIDDIFDFVSCNDSIENAENIIHHIEEKIRSLSKMAERGHIPPELIHTGFSDFREVHHKPFRIIYQLIEDNVFIHCVLDGRRNISDLLERRLLR